MRACVRVGACVCVCLCLCLCPCVALKLKHWIAMWRRGFISAGFAVARPELAECVMDAIESAPSTVTLFNRTLAAYEVAALKRQRPPDPAPWSIMALVTGAEKAVDADIPLN